MGSITTSGVWILGLLFCFALLWKLNSSRRYRDALRRRGCSYIAHYPHKDLFLGYDLYRITEKSKQRNDAIPTMQRLFDSFGKGKTFQALTLGIPTVYSIDPRIFRAVLKEESHNFGVEPLRKAFYSPWITTGVLVSDGQEWKTSRAVLRPLFQKSQYADLPGLTVHLNRLLALIPRDGTTFDLQPLVCRLVSGHTQRKASSF